MDTPEITPDVGQLILTLRGKRVILDSGLAKLYGVPTFRFNEVVKRNRHRFPDDFLFQLTREEAEGLTSQSAMSKPGSGGRRTLPWAFTEHEALQASTLPAMPNHGRWDVTPPMNVPCCAGHEDCLPLRGAIFSPFHEAPRSAATRRAAGWPRAVGDGPQAEPQCGSHPWVGDSQPSIKTLMRRSHQRANKNICEADHPQGDTGRCVLASRITTYFRGTGKRW